MTSFIPIPTDLGSLLLIVAVIILLIITLFGYAIIKVSLTKTHEHVKHDMNSTKINKGDKND